jgi:hypothetical protein
VSQPEDRIPGDPELISDLRRGQPSIVHQVAHNLHLLWRKPGFGHFILLGAVALAICSRSRACSNSVNGERFGVIRSRFGAVGLSGCPVPYLYTLVATDGVNTYLHKSLILF